MKRHPQSRYPRFVPPKTLRLKARLKTVDNTHVFYGKVRNISLGGLALVNEKYEGDFGFFKELKVDLLIYANGLSFKGMARLVSVSNWSTGVKVLHIEIIGYHQKGRETLSEMIELLAASKIDNLGEVMEPAALKSGKS